MSRRGLLPVDGRGLSLAGEGLVTAFAVIVAMALAPAPAQAFSADTGSRNAGAPAAYSTSVSLRANSAAAKKPKSNGNCSVGQMLVAALNPFSNCQPLNQAGQAVVNTVASLPGTIAGAAATGVMDQVTAWMVQAAQTISGWVVKEAGVITRPELDAAWYLNLFSGLAALGAALAGLVALIALGSAAIRKDPDALGEVIYGIARAGIGTSVVVALTIIALTAADSISNGFARQMPADFYKTLASQWGGSGWGGFGAAALAFVVAFVATIAGLFVWLELLVREAAIYIAVLFFPVALAASIWPALQMWVRRLGMLLLMFVLLRPVVVIVLALAGSVTSEGLAFGQGGIPHSVGTILAGVVIFALAAFTPWALMFLLGTEVGVLHGRGGGSANGRASTRRAGEGGEDARVGGSLTSGQPRLASGGELASATAGGGGSAADGAGGVGGPRIASLGGSGAPGGGGSGGSIAAAAGSTGVAAGAIGRASRQLGAHAAARIQVASGRPGVAPGGVLPAAMGFNGSQTHGGSARAAEPPDGGSPAAGAATFVDSIDPPSPPSAADASLSGAADDAPAQSMPPASAEVTDDGQSGEKGPPYSSGEGEAGGARE